MKKEVLKLSESKAKELITWFEKQIWDTENQIRQKEKELQKLKRERDCDYKALYLLLARLHYFKWNIDVWDWYIDDVNTLKERSKWITKTEENWIEYDDYEITNDKNFK